ncbi:PREDICTED: uncharacterized protein LOC104699280 [Camelina sativa]|uniref:Uncharacterized protein LOC104699280 n=1 Tax=Camelina sativa TaxID=90675 RepID=A0ABM1RSG2_CAMSA|nr:PREDICTED: uncharacterized protein LOC104699280 [Camelina sativa]
MRESTMYPKSRGIKVLLVQPHDEAASQQLFRTPESISNLVRVKPVVNQTASFYQDFSALEKLGYYSDCLVNINAYCEKSIGSRDELYDAGIYDVPEGDRHIRVNLMLNLMLLTATFYSKNNPKLLMVISKNLPNDTEFARVVGALQSRGIKVLLVQPHDEAASQQLFRTPESISNLVRVKPVVNQTASFYQDFSVPTTYVDAPKTGVFWDAQDSPLPNHLDPESIFQSIKSALEGKGYFAYISIWVYADEKITFSNELLNEYRKSDIYFLPKVPGDKNLRYDRMLHDIFLWEIDTPGGHAGPSNMF